MKFILYLFSMIAFTNGCNDGDTTSKTASNAQDDVTIEYEASTRGFYQKVQLSKAQISVTPTRGAEAITKEMSASDWKEIMQLLDKIDSEKLKNNYVNADDLQRDAVIPAKLTVNYKENTVHTVEFGHGNAPDILQPLMTKIEAMVNAVDKP